MGRLHLFEIGDEPRLPGALRDYLTDLLRFVSTCLLPCTRIVEHIGKVLDRAGTDAIVDLCSGGSGALAAIHRRLEEERRRPISVLLTDKYPNLAAFRAAREASGGRIDFVATPVDATAVPAGLEGVRTMFEALHHFRPEEARRILEDAARQRRAVCVFEGMERNAFVMLLTALLPLVVLLCTPFVRPFRIGRLFWTYVFPAVPLMATWDGFVSCVRTYSVEELERLVATIPAEGYVWEIGRSRTSMTPFHVTYLLGYPE